MIILVAPVSFFIFPQLRFHHLHYSSPNLCNPFPVQLFGYHLLSIRLILVISQQIILSILLLQLHLPLYSIILSLNDLYIRNPMLFLLYTTLSLILFDIFDGWFGIPFNDTKFFTRICSPHHSEILRLYGLSCLISLCPCILSAA